MSQEGLIVNPAIGGYKQWIEVGLELAELSESEGGWAEYFDKNEGLEIADDHMRAATAVMLENNKRWQATICKGRRNADGKFLINEATRSALIGGFSDHLFPIIRAAFPSNPVTDLVSVQPTTRRVATVVYWNWIYGTTKGGIAKGQRLFDANTGVPFTAGGNQLMTDYTGEDVNNEVAGVGDGSTAVISGTLTFNDGGGIRPGSVSLSATHATAGVVTFADNAAGGFVQTSGTGLTISSSSIAYNSGVWTITVSASNFTTANVTANYSQITEGSSLTPQVDIQIITSTTETQRRALQLNYSQESVQDIMAEFGTSLEPNLVSGAAELLNMEIAGQLIRRMWNVAPIYGTFSSTIPASGSGANISLEQWLRGIVYTLNGMSNNIWQRTQKGYGNWIVCDANAATLVESLPKDLFEAAPRPANVMGLHFIGTLCGKYRIYKWIWLRNEAGAVAGGNMLMGFKGTSFWEAGLVWSPYQIMYTTDTLTTANFLSQKGMASRYGVKMVNPNFYVRLSIT